jgi:hypothetical protein
MGRFDWFLVWLGQHGWWFWLWLDQHWTKPTQRFPWAEENQGLVSLIALVTALLLFLLEQKRANEAEQAGRDEAARQESLDKTRTREAIEREGFLSRLAAQNRVTEHVRVCAGIIENVAGDLDAEYERTSIASVRANNASWLWDPPEGLQDALEGLAASLTALLPGCPPDGELILATQRAANTARQAAGKKLSFTTGGALEWLKRVSDDLKASRFALNKRALAFIVENPVTGPA